MNMPTETLPATQEMRQTRLSESEDVATTQAASSRPRSEELDAQSEETGHPNTSLEELRDRQDRRDFNLLVGIVGKPSNETVQSLLDQLALRDQEASENLNTETTAHSDGPASLTSPGTTSVAPAAASFETDSVISIGAETALTELDVSVNGDDLRHMSDAHQEPFPDYFESCEKSITAVNRDHEAAYDYAIAKVVEEVIHFREVDSSISSLPIFNEQERSLCTEEDGRGSSETVEQERSSAGHGQRAVERDLQTDPASPGGMAHGSIPTESHELIDEMKDALADKSLKPRLRRRFASMSNMVLHMHRLLFPVASDNMPVQPTQFLSSKETIHKVNSLASEIIKYLVSIDGQVQEQVDSAQRVTYILVEVDKDRSVDVYVRYRRMAHVVIANLRKPRSIEERLLSLFLELYDAYVYSRFVQIRNRQIILETSLYPERLELSRFIIAIWDVLSRVIENYATHIHAMRMMKRRFFAPAMEELRGSPRIWKESWKRFEMMIRLDEEDEEDEDGEGEGQEEKEGEAGSSTRGTTTRTSGS